MALAVVGYTVALVGSFLLAYLLRFDFGGDPAFAGYRPRILAQALWIIPF